MQPKEDGQFQVPEWINDNAYKMDLPSEYNIIATFNIYDPFLFDVGNNLRSNLFLWERKQSELKGNIACND